MRNLTLVNSKLEDLSHGSRQELGENFNAAAPNRPPTNGNGDGSQPFQTRTARLAFPRFDGVDPSRWVYRVEQLFLHQQTPNTQKLLLASFHLEGQALQWYRWVERAGAISYWEDFTQALLVRFGPNQFEDPTALLTKLRQASTVEHYQTQFEELANRTEGLHEPFMISCFVGGLREDIELSV